MIGRAGRVGALSGNSPHVTGRVGIHQNLLGCRLSILFEDVENKDLKSMRLIVKRYSP